MDEETKVGHWLRDLHTNVELLEERCDTLETAVDPVAILDEIVETQVDLLAKSIRGDDNQKRELSSLVTRCTKCLQKLTAYLSITWGRDVFAAWVESNMSRWDQQFCRAAVATKVMAILRATMKASTVRT